MSTVPGRDRGPATGTLAAGAVLLALAATGWWLDRTLFWAAYLAGWWFCLGLSLGALANLWIHNLTGGRWGEAIRAPLHSAARALPALALLFVPLLFALPDLWPWATHAGDGDRWTGELARPGFKQVWLTPAFFIARSVCYLLIFVLLERLSRRPGLVRSARWSAAALIIYAVTGSLAATDWLMSLSPLWHSTGFGLLVLTGQGLSALCLAIVAVTHDRTMVPALVMRDLGNLLLTYVMTWAYLAYTQFLIIWAANLPHEIGWYVLRLQTPWVWVAGLLVAAHFFLPLLILLSREAKQSARVLGGLAMALLVLHLVDVCWLVVPSVRPLAWQVLWLAPLTALGLLALGSSGASLSGRTSAPGRMRHG